MSNTRTVEAGFTTLGVLCRGAKVPCRFWGPAFGLAVVVQRARAQTEPKACEVLSSLHSALASLKAVMRVLAFGVATMAITLAFGSPLQAQTTIAISPFATYLTTSQDPGAVPATAIPLSTLGVHAGDSIVLQTEGEVSYCVSPPDPPPSCPPVAPDLAGLFSSTPSATGAIAADGPAIVTPPTYYGNISTDIPQDFAIPPSPDSTTVTVPDGAQYLFVIFPDSFYGDNGDSTLAVQITSFPLTVLHSFGGADGATPLAGLVMDAAGNLYGTTSGGGGHSAGTVFKVDTSFNESVLYSFTGGADGGSPQSDLIMDSAGNLFGTTTSGGRACFGTVFKLDTTGNESVLHCFLYFPDDGADPDSGLVMDATGTLYGATPGGGANLDGILYKLNSLNEETILHSFSGPPHDGEGPEGIAMDKEGNVYGTTFYGESSTLCCGAVFEFDVHGTETILHNFTGGADGALPWAGPIVDENGNIYGTTSQGGVTADCPVGCGTVFKVDTSSHESVLYTFKGGTDGRFPRASLARDAEGNLYGTTLQGGDTSVNNGAGYGTVFELNASGGETVLHSFTGGSDGRLPKADLILDAAGNIYGTAQSGGAHGAGTVFKISVSSQQALPNMIAYLDSLNSQGVLNSGQHNSLIKQLQKAVDMWNAGKTSGALHNLQDFIGEVNDLASSGILSPAQAGALISGANSVITPPNACLDACQTTYDQAQNFCVLTYDPSSCGGNTTCEGIVQQQLDQCLSDAGTALNQCFASCSQ